jgi:hypothetical protein
MKKIVGSVLMTLLAGCATSFTGSAHVEDGRAGCERKCAGQGLAMEGLVYMGEYSSACVCAVPGSQGSGAAASVAGGAAGVVMHMRAQEQQRTRMY